MMFKPASPWSWTFIGVSVAQACVILAFECYIFATFQLDVQNNATDSMVSARTIPTFLTLYIFGFIYQLLLVWDALRLKNTIQIIGLVAYNVGLLVYGAVQTTQIRDALANVDDVSYNNETWHNSKPFLIAIPCILGLTTIILAFAAWKLYGEFAWTIYKHISADLRMKRRYLAYQVYIALLKFDFFFFLGFTVQFVVIVSQRKIEFALTIAAIPVTIFILLAAAFFTRKEWLSGTLGVIILYFGGLAYFTFKMVRMYTHNSRQNAYLPARKELTAFAVLTILLIVMTIINACLCASNYRKGLKPYVSRRKPDSEEEKMPGMDMGPGSSYAPYATEMQPGGMNGKMPPPRPMAQRMEID